MEIQDKKICKFSPGKTVRVFKSHTMCSVHTGHFQNLFRGNHTRILFPQLGKPVTKNISRNISRQLLLAAPSVPIAMESL